MAERALLVLFSGGGLLNEQLSPDFSSITLDKTLGRSGCGAMRERGANVYGTVSIH